MKKILFLFLIVISLDVLAQPIYQATSSLISFHAGTPVEDIDADNSKALSFLNITSGEITISIPVKDFRFKRPLMQEHFNENYLESAKYPKAEFKGMIHDIEKIDFTSGTTQEMRITGTLNLHGVSNEIILRVTIDSSDKKIKGEAKFVIALVDYKIDRPKILWQKIAENIDVTSTFTYEPFKK